MQAIQDECEEFLRVLLIETLELLADLRDALFKLSRYHHRSRFPHLLHLYYYQLPRVTS
jgi:hypothetical protein